jgi:hypothetical protein
LSGRSVVAGGKISCETAKIPKGSKHAVFAGHFSMGDADVQPCVMNWRDPVSRVVSAIGYYSTKNPDRTIHSESGRLLDVCCPGELAVEEFAESYMEYVNRRGCVAVCVVVLSLVHSLSEWCTPTRYTFVYYIGHYIL